MKVKEITITLPNGQETHLYKYRVPETNELKYSSSLETVIKDIFKTRFHLYRHLGLCIDLIHALDIDPADTFTDNSPGWKRFKALFNFESDDAVYKFALENKKLNYQKEEKTYDLLCKPIQKMEKTE